ncbi:hypothetical protein ACIBLA_23940 [Streptomyces sp. NPDC050433]|uniref:hypothetical protein n=1 Tax=unclassified Streptomyces TaxID=2593676 RepID=UPI003445A8B6
MSFLPRASWSADRRDEVVAAALVAAVVVVLGYASGIGAPGPDAVNTASPPATSPAPTPSAPSGDTGPPDGDSGAGPGAQDPGGGGLPVGGGLGGGPVGEVDWGVGVPGDGTGGHTGHGGPSGPPASPVPSPTPTPSPTPSDPGPCQDGEVRLVQPLLNGVITPLYGLAEGLLAPGTPSPAPSTTPSPSTGAASTGRVCTGLDDALGALGGGGTASPAREATSEATP